MQAWSLDQLICSPEQDHFAATDPIYFEVFIHKEMTFSCDVLSYLVSEGLATLKMVDGADGADWGDEPVAPL